MKSLSKPINSFVRNFKFNQRIYSPKHQCYYVIEDGRVSYALSLYNPIDGALGKFPIDIETSLKRKVNEQA